MKIIRLVVAFAFSYPALCVANMDLPVAFRMPTSAMEPSIPKGSLIVQEPLNQLEQVKRGDLVLVKDPDNSKLYAMRVVGMPTERINMNSAGVVFVGGNMLDESQYNPRYSQAITQNLRRPVTGARYISIPNGKFFLLFDQRENPNDSRLLGLFDRSQLLARIVPWQSIRDIPGRAKRSLERMIVPVARRLPLEVGEGIHLTNASALSDEAFSATYTIDFQAEQMPPKKTLESVYASIFGYFCSLPSFGSLGVSVQYIVQDIRGQTLASLSFNPAKCKE